MGSAEQNEDLWHSSIRWVLLLFQTINKLSLRWNGQAEAVQQQQHQQQITQIEMKRCIQIQSEILQRSTMYSVVSEII